MHEPNRGSSYRVSASGEPTMPGDRGDVKKKKNVLGVCVPERGVCRFNGHGSTLRFQGSIQD